MNPAKQIGAMMQRRAVLYTNVPKKSAPVITSCLSPWFVASCMEVSV